MQAVQSTTQQVDLSASQFTDMRGYIEKSLDHGSARESGIDAAHVLASAIWTRAAELGLIVSREKEAKFGCVVDRIKDFSFVMDNGRIVEVTGLAYNASSSMGGLEGQIRVVNQKGNELDINFVRGGVYGGFIDGSHVIVGDGQPETKAFIKLANRITQQILAADLSGFVVGEENFTVRQRRPDEVTAFVKGQDKINIRKLEEF